MLTEAIPGLSRVALLWTSASPGHTLTVRESQEASQGLGSQTQLLDVREASALEGAFAAMVQERAEALVMINDQLFLTHRTRLVELAGAYRLPTIYGN